MTLITCTGKNGELIKDYQAVSTDTKVEQDIKRIVGDSSQLVKVTRSDDLFVGFGTSQYDLNIIKDSPYCFADGLAANTIIDLASNLVLYNWNTEYPADIGIKFISTSWKEVNRQDLVGDSHENITRVEYVRVNSKGGS